jgi:putative ABC transport system permease protein
MELLRGLWRRMAHAFGRRRFESELEDEVAFHVESRARDLEAAGLPPAEAARQARLRFGRQAAVREDSREVWIARWLDQVGRDVRLAVRSLRRTPGFTVVAALTLALGIGGNAALASLLDAALFKPLPFPDADRLVSITLKPPPSSGERTAFPWSFPKFRTLAATTTAFDGVAGYDVVNVNVGTGAEAERLVAEEVSADYLRILGVRPVLGRIFESRVDSVPGGDGVVILSYTLWRRRFGGDSGIVGKAVTIHGHPLTVVGVLPRGFTGLSLSADLWVPLTSATLWAYPEILDEDGNYWLQVVARTRPGVELPAARADLDQAGAVIARLHPYENQAAPWHPQAAPLGDGRIEPGVRRALVVLFGAVAVVLLIACVNLVNLFLARTAGRQREMAVRLAIGAGAPQVVRQLATESLVLSLLGGTLGLLLARVGLPVLLRMAPSATAAGALVDMRSASIDGRVLGYTLVITVVTGLLIGLVPALRAARSNVAQAFRRGAGWGGEPEVGGGRRFGPQRWLVAFETALALVLLVGAGLLVRSLVRLQDVDLGFDGRRVLTFRISATDQDLAARDPVRFKVSLLDQLRAVAGVRDAGVGTCFPLTSACIGSVVKSDPTKPAPAENQPIGVHYVSPGYFTTLGIQLRAGRLFDERDRPGSGRVVVVSEAAAKAIWPGESPIGKRLSVYTAYFSGGDSTAEVIGVVGDVHYGTREETPTPQVYAPALQASFRFATFVVATDGDPLAVEEAVRRAVLRVNPGLPIYDVRTMAEREAVASARPRFATFVLLVFAGLGLLLASVGVYGVMAYAVQNRTREMGIRLALGADPARLGRMVLAEAGRTAGLGLGLGLVGALILTRLLRSLLYQVDPRDPGVLVPAALLLFGVALAAAWIPARRAAATDPMRSIRNE